MKYEALEHFIIQCNCIDTNGYCAVITNIGFSNKSHICSGVSQGCQGLCYLLYLSIILCICQIGSTSEMGNLGDQLGDPRFADDTVISISEEHLHQHIHSPRETCKDFHMKMNTEKTDVITC